jgi:methyltransferase
MGMRASSISYLVFVVFAVGLAGLERRHALGNERRLRREGAIEIAPWVFALMVPVYSFQFAGAVAEHLLLGRRPPAVLVTAMLGLFAAAKALKFWAVRHLGDAWTMRVFVPRRLRVAVEGPYRFLRHPNYVAVVAEIVAVPLAGGAWITAVVSALLFAPVLAARIRTEEAALLARPEYAAAMAAKGRFVPRSGR